MIQEQIESMPILDLIYRPDFYSLTISEFKNLQYWEIVFTGKRVVGKIYYEWEGKQSPQPLFKIFKTKQPYGTKQ